MRLRREQIAALAARQVREKRAAQVAELEARGLEVEDRNERELVLRDKLGAETAVELEPQRVTITTPEQRKMQFRYDGHAQLREVVDPGGLAVRWKYDHRGRLTTLTRGEASPHRFEYDQRDAMVAIVWPDGSTTRYHRTGSGKVRKVVDRNGRESRRSYNKQGLLDRVVDWQGNEVRFEYDGFDQPSAVELPDMPRREFDYDESGALRLLRIGGREHAAFLHDEAEGRYRVDYHDGGFVELTYKDDRLQTAVNEHGALRFEYDEQGQLIAEETDGRRVEYLRDPLGYLAGIVGPAGQRVRFERDRDHRVARVIDWQGERYDVGHHANGALRSIRFPNGAAVATEATPLGHWSSLRITSPRGSLRPLADWRWRYDACDRVVEAANDDVQLRYTYDAESRLTAVDSTAGEAGEAYTLDANGNRAVDQGQACTYNGSNQLLSRGSQAFAYDELGCQTAGPVPTGDAELRYNARGQLVAARTPNGQATYAYDALGRRVLKKHGGKTTRYTWAGGQLLSETVHDGAGQRQRDYLFFAGTDLPLAMRDGEHTYYFHCGRRAEPLAMTDASGRVVWQAEYSAFGVARTQGPGRFQPWRLAGQYCDEETGLYYNKARYYHPELGRYLSPDPRFEDGGSLNFYTYCDGDPLNRLDPEGELFFVAIVVGFAIGAAIGAGMEYYRQRQAVKSGEQAEYEPWKIAGAGLVGGVIGAIGGGVGALAEAGLAAAVGAGIGGAAIIGGVSGAASSIAEQCAEAAIKKEPLDPLKVAKDAAIDGLLGAAIGAVTAGIGGIFARRAKKAAIQASNMVPDHAQAFSRVAKDRVEVIMVRPVNPDATPLIAANNATKSMHIKGKSADWGPHRGTIPVDPKYSKLGNPNGKPPSPDELKVFDNYNKKALGEPYEVPIKDKDGKIVGWEKHKEVPAVATKIEVAGPDGKKIEVLADPGTGKPITADYDLFAVGSKDPGPVKPFDPDKGILTTNELELLDELNKGVNYTGYTGGNVAHHGPANRFEKTLDPKADFPITAYTPDGRIHTIKDKSQLESFMVDQNKKGYQVEQHPDWGLDPSIPTAQQAPK